MTGLTFEQLLAYRDQETGRWHGFFGQDSEALRVVCDIARQKDVAGLVYHIFAVERLHTERLKTPSIVIAHSQTPITFLSSGVGLSKRKSPRPTSLMRRKMPVHFRPDDVMTTLTKQRSLPNLHLGLRQAGVQKYCSLFQP